MNMGNDNGRPTSIPRSMTRKLREWMGSGMPSTEAKALREVFSPSFEGSFSLQCPKLEHSMKRRLVKTSRKKSDLVEKALLSTQYKVLDVARPLLELWRRLPENDPSAYFAESALRLWGVAFAEVSKHRRWNVLRQTDPSFTSLLSDPASFSGRDVKDLFGDHFLKVMVREADQDDKLAKVGRVGGSGSYRPPSRR